MPEMVPLRIDLSLGGPMAVPDRFPVLLDSLLLALQGRLLTLPFRAVDLPVKSVKVGRSGEFFWLASALKIDWVGPSTDRFMHRNARPMELFEDRHLHRSTTVDFDRGLTKVSRKRLTVRQADAAHAWCIGDMQAIETLMGDLQAVGPHRHLGLGLVRQVRVVEDEQALTKAWLRPVPANHVASDPHAGSRVRSAGRASPPYWDRNLDLQAWWPAPELLR